MVRCRAIKSHTFGQVVEFEGVGEAEVGPGVEFEGVGEAEVGRDDVHDALKPLSVTLESVVNSISMYPVAAVTVLGF